MKKIDSDRLASSYDFFYYFYKILLILSNVNKVEKFFKEKNIKFTSNIHGYLYFVELLIIQVIHRIELLLDTNELDEFVRWGRKDLSNKQISELKKSNKLLKYIFELNTCRKKFSTIRHKDINNKEIFKQLENITEELQVLLSQINKYLIKKYKIEKIKNSESVENISLLHWINDFNFIKGSRQSNSSIFEDLSNKEPLPMYPGHPFFYLMSKEINKNYSLQDENIKNKNSQYLIGLKISLLYLYHQIKLKNINNFEKNILNVNSWIELDSIGQTIYDEYISGEFNFKPLFIMDENSIKSDENRLISFSHINKIEQFDTVFRGRDIKVIDENFAYDDYQENWFLHILYGALSRNEFFDVHNLDDAPQIIEFREMCGIEIKYSYAIYFPKKGVISDSSHWVIFKDLDCELIFDRKLYFRRKFEEIMKKIGNNFHFKSIIVEDDLLTSYVNTHDLRLKSEIKQEAIISYHKGLLTEFLSYLFVNKKYNAVLLDIHRAFNNSDIDLIAESKEFIIIVEAKQFLPFDKHKLKSISTHLDNYGKNFSKKTIKKILFVMNTPSIHNIPQSDMMILFEEKRRNKNKKIEMNNLRNFEDLSHDKKLEYIESSITSIMDSDIVKKVEEITDYLIKNDVELVYYEDLKKFLKNNPDLNNKIEAIYQLNKEKNLDLMNI